MKKYKPSELAIGSLVDSDTGENIVTSKYLEDKTTMKNKETKPSWEDRLEERDVATFGSETLIHLDGKLADIDDLKDFIREELKAERQKCVNAIKEIINMSGEDSSQQWYDALRCAKSTIESLD